MLSVNFRVSELQSKIERAKREMLADRRSVRCNSVPSRIIVHVLLPQTRQYTRSALMRFIKRNLLVFNA